MTRKNRRGEKKTKKGLSILACIFVLTALIGNSLQILEARPVIADANYLTAQFPIEHLGPATSNPTTVLTPQDIRTVLTPQDIRTAYNLPSTGGNGTIAIIDPYNDPTILDDAAAFSNEWGLQSINLEIHMMSQSISNTSDASEISLDVEWAHAIAPSAKILLVEATSATFPDVLPAIDYARNRSDVVAVSMSWDWTEQEGPFSLQYSNGTIVPVPFTNESLYDSYFTGSNGVSFFAASGDHSENVSWPACSPNVVGVGGTTLDLYLNDSLASETVWNDGNGWATGGGVSQYENETSYQQSYDIQGSNGHRGVPDVSFDAGTPVYVYDSFDNSTNPWQGDIGTSLGAPCWAAIYSLRPTASNPILYKIAKSVYNSSSFRDITTGTNGNYNATSGYDFCTGLGSPLTGAFIGATGDIKLDGTVNILDAILLGNAFLSTPGSPRWNALADLDNNGIVNILDAIILGNSFAHHWPMSGASGQSSSVGTMATGGPSVLVDPSQVTVFKGENLTVNVEVTGVTDLYGWEFKLYWNSTVLNCTNVVVQTPAEWQNNTQSYGSGLEANYNATDALYWQGQSATYPASSFNGSMTIATLTFQAMQPGTTALTLTDTILGNSTAEPIACSVSSGSVTVYYGRYMRSDTQTINGLGAYVLNIPESTSSASFTQSGSGNGASWGIRAFVRHSDGTEQEISLDGQTGTPKAVVSRSSGSGIEGGTVSVAQTALQQTDSFVIRVYVQVGGSGWTLCATFTTEQLHATTLQATTWTVYYYTYAYYLRPYNSTVSTFYWGTTTYNSQIQNLQYG